MKEYLHCYCKISLFPHFYADYRRALALLSLFLATGLLIIIYLNQYDAQPRERDYSYVGSFFTFSIWISIGLCGLLETLKRILSSNKGLYSQIHKMKIINQRGLYVGILVLMFLLMPCVMLLKDYDEHSRRGNYVAWDYAYNLLNSCAPKGIIFTNGDN